MPQGGTNSRLTTDSVAAINATADDSISSQFENIPEIMEFESWWSESGQKRYMLILYYCSRDVFEVMVDDSTVPIKVAIFNRKNQPLKPWDLYVGAVLDMLGKPTTLMKAKQSTMEWIDSQAHRLWEKKKKLVSVLEKFATVPDLTPLSGVTVRKLDCAKSCALGGTVNLSKLATTVVYLQNEVKLYRDVSV